MFFIIMMSYVTAMTVAGPIGNNDTHNVNKTLMPTRRILQGHPVGDTKPYMVYLRPSPTADPKFKGSDWLCGGVIIHERYILTSAACIEDAKNFYVVSGTSKWSSISEKHDECVNNGAKKAVWKCVPKSYVFDGNEFDNIRWMVGDIAVVKVEDEFNFERRIQGCEFIPKKIAYNNVSTDITKPRTFGSIAGWGSNVSYKDWMQKPAQRAGATTAELLETEVRLMSSANCKKRWDPRYHYLIDAEMLCSRDVSETAMSNVCAEQEVDCKELTSSEDDDYADYGPKDGTFRRVIIKPGQLKVDSAGHFHDTRRSKSDVLTGGFCENDHGGPLIVGHGKSAMVVGLMSACLTKDITRKCYGPFLYTSVFHHRNMITCAIDKDLGLTCKKLLRSSTSPISETNFDWSYHPDGPAKTETNNNKEVLREGSSTEDGGLDEVNKKTDKYSTKKSTRTTTKHSPKTKPNKKKS